MQQGLFMFPYTLNENEHNTILDDNTKVIRIHKDLRESLLTYLDTLGINAFRIMPDLASVCGAVERKVKDKRASNIKFYLSVNGVWLTKRVPLEYLEKQ